MTPPDQPPLLPEPEPTLVPPDEVIELVPDDEPDAIPVVRLYRRTRRPEPPPPSFLRALLWCLGLLVCLYVPLLVVGGVTFAIMAYSNGNAREFWRAEREQMREALAYEQAKEKPPGDPPAMPDGISYSIAAGMAAGHAGSLALALALLRFSAGPDWRRKVALRRPAFVPLLMSLMILPGLMVTHSAVHAGLQQAAETAFEALNSGADAGTGSMDTSLRAMLAPWPLGLAVLLIGVGPGVIEELFCRGYLGRGLVARYGIVGGVVLTSMLFGMLHLLPLYAIGTMVMGIFLHLTYLATRSLWVPVLLHFLNNSITVLAVMGVPTLPGLLVDPAELPAAVYLLGVALTAAGFWALWTSRARLESTVSEHPAWRPAFPGVELPPPGSGTVVRHPWPNPLAVVFTLVTLIGLVYYLS